MTVLHLAQIRLFVLLSLLSHLRFWQPPFPTDAYERQPRGPGSAVRNRTSGDAQLGLTRRDGPGRATSTRTMRRCLWRLGYRSAPPLLQGASRGRESLREFLFASTRRAALRTRRSSICPKATCIGHKTLPAVS